MALLWRLCQHFNTLWWNWRTFGFVRCPRDGTGCEVILRNYFSFWHAWKLMSLRSCQRPSVWQKGKKSPTKDSSWKSENYGSWQSMQLLHPAQLKEVVEATRQDKSCDWKHCTQISESHDSTEFMFISFCYFLRLWMSRNKTNGREHFANSCWKWERSTKDSGYHRNEKGRFRVWKQLGTHRQTSFFNYFYIQFYMYKMCPYTGSSLFLRGGG